MAITRSAKRGYVCFGWKGATSICLLGRDAATRQRNKTTISVSGLASLSDPEASNRSSASAYIALLPVAIDGPRSQLLPSILNAF